MRDIGLFLLSISLGKCLYATHVTYNEQDKDILKNAHREQITLHVPLREHSEQRLDRKAILVRYDSAVATILLCHGFLCDKYDIACFRNMFPVGRFNFLTFDFRGHGENANGQISTLGHDEALDVVAAGEFIHTHPKLADKPLFVWSFSMGAAAAIEAQAHYPGLFTAMILDSSFDSTENLIKHNFDRIKFSLFGYDLPGRSVLERYAFHPYVQSFVKHIFKSILHLDTHQIYLYAKPIYPAKSITQVKVPCFFIHCANDEKIPLASVHALYNGVEGYKRLWITKGRRHFDSFFYNPEQYAYKVRKFIEQVLDQSLYQKKRAKIVDESETVVT
jgi:pimeloyl-ACP methyl ester carboxylesterase